MIKVVDHELPDFETSAQFKVRLDNGIPDAMLNQICDGQINFFLLWTLYIPLKIPVLITIIIFRVYLKK